MIAAVAGLSFAYFDPKVTVGFFVLRRSSFLKLLLYWSAELSGKVVVLLCLLDKERLEAVSYGATLLSPDIWVSRAVLLSAKGWFTQTTVLHPHSFK